MILNERRICICVPSFEAEPFIRATTQRIPWADMPNDLEYHVLFIDNQSEDGTWAQIAECQSDLTHIGCTSAALRNDTNLGYGASVKKALDYCRQHDFGYLVILHADGQYRPEDLPRLLDGARQRRDCALFFGSRLAGSPLAGGMPVYKYLANLALTKMQNSVLGTGLTEFHSGYRLYRTSAVCALPYQHNSDYFDFDNHIIFQIVHAGYAIDEAAIATFYGNEKSHVGLLRTPLAILTNTFAYMLHKWGLVRVRRYQARSDDDHDGGTRSSAAAVE